MPYYLMLTKLTDAGRKTIREHPEPVEEINREIEQMAPDARVVSQWFLLGPYDFASIVQAPDNWHMSFIAMELGSRGILETLTMPALQIQDFITFMKAEGQVAYRRRKPSSASG